MAHALHYAQATKKDKKKFQKYLAEDEELVLVTGFGKNYLRHRFALYLLFPGVVFWVLGVGVSYYWGLQNNLDPTELLRVALGFGLLGGLLAAAFYAYLQTIWNHHAHRYLLTNRRVVIKKGLFTVRLTSALYDKITHIEVDQSWFDRLVMKHGDLILNTAGVHKDELRLSYIDYPIEFKNILEKLINKEREYSRSYEPVLPIEGELVT